MIVWFKQCQLQVIHYRKLCRLYSGKWKTAYFAIFKLYLLCFIQSMGSGPYWYQIGNKACCILKVSKFYAKKKVVLFPEINWVTIFLSPARPHMSNVYENIYFSFKKIHKQSKKFPLANLFVQIYVFFPFKQ